MFLGRCYTLGNFLLGHSGEELNEFSTIEIEPLTDEDCEKRETFLKGYSRSHYRNYVCMNFRADALVSKKSSPRICGIFPKLMSILKSIKLKSREFQNFAFVYSFLF